MTELAMPKFAAPPLNEHYEGAYDERTIQWRRLGAMDKAGNVGRLLGDRKGQVQSVLEVGCGTGAVLLELARLQIGELLTGIDMANPNEHTDADVIDAGITLLHHTDEKLPFPDDTFDLVVASHVLEHVEDERGFLRELKRVSRSWIYLEVPCELHIRSNTADLQRTLNIGHINAFTPESFALTISTAGLAVERMGIFDHSLAVHSFWSGRAKGIVKAFVRRTMLKLNPKLASRFATFHVGALCSSQ